MSKALRPAPSCYPRCPHNDGGPEWSPHATGFVDMSYNSWHLAPLLSESWLLSGLVCGTFCRRDMLAWVESNSVQLRTGLSQDYFSVRSGLWNPLDKELVFSKVNKPVRNFFHEKMGCIWFMRKWETSDWLTCLQSPDEGPEHNFTLDSGLRHPEDSWGLDWERLAVGCSGCCWREARSKRQNINI